MPHYQDGSEAKVGDFVKGPTGPNDKNILLGVVHTILDELPTPLIASSASLVDGRCSAIAVSVASVNTVNAGLPA